MAKAQLNEETIKKVTGITLELTIEEAVMLESLTAHVYGRCMDSPRVVTNAIGAALREAGIRRVHDQGRRVTVFGGSFAMEWVD